MDSQESEFDPSIFFGDLNSNFISENHNQFEAPLSQSANSAPLIAEGELASPHQALEGLQFDWSISNLLSSAPTAYWHSFFNLTANNNPGSQSHPVEASMTPSFFTESDPSAAVIDTTQSLTQQYHPYSTQFEDYMTTMPAPTANATHSEMAALMPPSQLQSSSSTNESFTLNGQSVATESAEESILFHPAQMQAQAGQGHVPHMDPTLQQHQNIQPQFPLDLDTSEQEDFSFLDPAQYQDEEQAQEEEAYDSVSEQFSDDDLRPTTPLPQDTREDERRYYGGTSIWAPPFADYENPIPVLNLPQGRRHDDGYQEEFADWRTVQQYRVAHLARRNPATDPTLPQNNEDCQRYVKQLFFAMSNLEETRDNAAGLVDKPSQAWRSFHSGKYNPKQIQAVCWDLLMRCVERQQRGPLVPEWQRTSNKAVAEFPSFSDRIREICSALQHHKTVCKRLMDSIYIDGLVDNPKAHMDRAVSNKKVNLRKAEVIRVGREVKERIQEKIGKKTGATDESTPNSPTPTEPETSMPPARQHTSLSQAQGRAPRNGNSGSRSRFRIPKQSAPEQGLAQHGASEQNLYLDPSLITQGHSKASLGFSQQGEGRQYNVNRAQPSSLTNQFSFELDLGNNPSRPSTDGLMAQLRRRDPWSGGTTGYNGSAAEIFKFVGEDYNRGKFLLLARLYPQNLFVRDKQVVRFAEGKMEVVNQHYYDHPLLRDLKDFEMIRAQAVEETAVESIRRDRALSSSRKAARGTNMAGQPAYSNISAPYSMTNTDNASDLGATPYFYGSSGVSLDPRTVSFPPMTSSNPNATGISPNIPSTQGAKRKRPADDKDSDYDPNQNTRSRRKLTQPRNQ